MKMERFRACADELGPRRTLGASGERDCREYKFYLAFEKRLKVTRNANGCLLVKVQPAKEAGGAPGEKEEKERTKKEEGREKRDKEKEKKRRKRTGKVRRRKEEKDNKKKRREEKRRKKRKRIA